MKKRHLKCKRSNSRLYFDEYIIKMPKSNRSQISIEYLIIIGFVSMVLIGILGVAFFYSSAIKDRIKITQVNNFANKVISSAESVYYYGEPSKTTISVYLPDGVENIEFMNNQLIITTMISSGIEKTSFSSNVPIDGTIIASSGIKRLVITALQNKTRIISS